MKTLFRYELNTPSPHSRNRYMNVIKAPQDSEVLTIQEDGEHLYIWLAGDPNSQNQFYTFLTIETTEYENLTGNQQPGDSQRTRIPEAYNTYIGTVPIGTHTYHIFQET